MQHPQQPTDLKELIESFFKNLKSTITWEGDILNVSGVPSDFEVLYGKKSPYQLTFSHEKSSDSIELIAKGSFILKAISEYLDRKGQTTSLKLNFDEDFLGAFKRYLKLRNAEIQNLSKSETYERIYKFTFQTLLQYLNEKEQIINSLHIKGDKVIPFNLDSFSYTPFNIEGDSYQLEAKNAYTVAKDNLKNLITPRLSETSKILQQKVKNEQERIKNHYGNQRKEVDTVIARLYERLAEIEKQKAKGQLTLVHNEAKIKEQLKELESLTIKEKLKKEEEFFLNDELHKHSLNISSKLLSTTIINCPIFDFKVTVNSKDSARQLHFKFDPLTNELSPKVNCELCKLPTTDLFLCSSGHLSCVNCLRKCGDCSRDLCSKCFQNSCDHCAKRLCRRCMKKCPSCHATICSFHTKVNRLTGKESCTRCVQQCKSCSNYYPKNHLNADSTCMACVKLVGLKKRFET